MPSGVPLPGRALPPRGPRRSSASGNGLPPPKIASCNWLRVEREVPPRGVWPGNTAGRERMRILNGISEWISRSFVLDPAIHLGPELLAPSSGDARPNLELRTRTGEVNVDLWILGDPRPPAESSAVPERISIYIEATNVILRIHSVGDRPIDLTIEGAGYLNLSVPRTFNGTLNLATPKKNITLSDPVARSIMFTNDGPEGVAAVFGFDATREVGAMSKIVAAKPNATVTLGFTRERRKFLGIRWPVGK
ncbi:hypothetical protein AURDEDRAFT_123424 [Auricularia subglabra TFB-10046 SS5]|nr:hypothetical protein AURDEDRAFT_123424 [Auricularia subglabra TFB-10046 SS5]